MLIRAVAATVRVRKFLSSSAEKKGEKGVRPLFMAIQKQNRQCKSVLIRVKKTIFSVLSVRLWRDLARRFAARRVFSVAKKTSVAGILAIQIQNLRLCLYR
jgi:hypothetical protein